MSAEPAQLLRRLEWDSQFWGFGVARLAISPSTMGVPHNFDTWCEEQHIAVVMALVPLGETGIRKSLELEGFTEVDRRVTLRTELDRVSVGSANASDLITIRHATEADSAACGNIAARSHRASRFSVDPGFPQSRSDDLYRLWVINDIAGSAAAVFVADERGVALGYLSLSVDPASSTGQISLLGVAPSERRRGIASALLARSVEYLNAQQLHQIIVVTQGRNDPALKFYERNHFSIVGEVVWLHRWFKN